MRRRSRTGGEPVKTRRGNPATLKRRNAAKAVRGSSAANQETEVARLTREITEAREERAAIADVLRIISNSPGELEQVFQAMLENALRICEAKFGSLFLFDGKAFHSSVHVGAPLEYVEFQRRRGPFLPKPGTQLERMMQTKRVTHTADETAETTLGPAAKFGGGRSTIRVPMLKGDVLVGAITIWRQQVRPFTDRQIGLVQHFAAQAVIAIENARLLSELRQRTTDLTESLEQQTATSEVLKIISSSPGDLKPVFDTIIADATRICEANFGLLQLSEDGGFRAMAMHNLPPAFVELRRREPLFRPGPLTVLARAVATKQLVHVADLAEHPGYQQRDPGAVRFVEVAGARTVVVVPMLKEDDVIGTIQIYRKEVRPFTDKQIALLQNFAAQAVIAIENSRLLNELRQSLEQQTATADVLKVISGSPGELQPVFDAMLANATRICEAKFGSLYLYQGEGFYLVATHNTPLAFAEERKRAPYRPHKKAPSARLVRTKSVIHVTDLMSEESYLSRDPNTVAAVERGGCRTLLMVPMVKEAELVGYLSIYRQEVRPFTDKQVELVKNFAAQAVIAIENARLLNELRESLAQQTATSEVLGVISSSPNDLRPVFDALAENAARLCDGLDAHIQLREGNMLRYVAHYGGVPTSPVVGETRSLTPELVIGRAILDARPIHILDLQAETKEFPEGSATARRNGYRTILAVPLMREGAAIGTIAIRRVEAKLFSAKQVELVSNFAAQAVIAIENTRLLNELRQRTDDLTESLEQQTATSEVLKVISSSRGDVEPVFQAILENAVRICKAKFGTLYLREGDGFRAAAMHNAPPAYAEKRTGILRFNPNLAIWKAAQTKQPAQTADITKLQAYVEGDPWLVSAVSLAGFRSVLCVPMQHEDEVLGGITIFRQEAGPFPDKQVELLTNFAKQAVIAIENTRLLNELRQSLEQQTATADVLGVISSSPGELKPVFQAMLENATRICEANFGVLHRYESGGFRIGATHNAPSAFAQAVAQREPIFCPSPQHPLARVAATKQVIQVSDLAVDEAYKQRDPGAVRLVELAGARSLIAVPMLKDDVLIGDIVIYRQEVRPFTDKQIALVQNFAAQAVIAIENTRLLNELRESLEQQMATADVLGVISSSPGELEPVFQAMLKNAIRICEANFGTLFRFDGKLFHPAADVGSSPELSKFRRERGPFHPETGSHLQYVMQTKQVMHIADVTAETIASPAARLGSARSTVCVPMLKEDLLVGVIFIYRQEVRPFTDKQIELLQNFAAQAVIAIENARLLNELRQSLQQQTATADVLKVISRSTFDLKTVLNTLVELVARLCEADMAAIRRPKGSAFLHVASHGAPVEYNEYMQSYPIEPGRGTVSGRVLLEGKPVHVPDVQADPEYTMVDISRRTGYHTILGLPLLREGNPIGVIILGRTTVRPFTDKQIELATTFADQAVIAIENVRLFDEIQDKSRQLEEASQHKSQFLANMSHELRTPLNAILGYTELMADSAYGEPSEEMLGVLKRLEANGRHLLGLINDVLDLSKIEAGQLVLELSDYCIEDIVQTVRSTLEPLAADKKLAFQIELAPQLPSGQGDGRRLTQVLINLVGNAIKFTDAGEIAIRAEANNGSFYVAVRDTGPGISAADQARLFQEFQQADNAITKKKGGTGLGLAISKRIIEMHGGRIWVEFQPGQGSTFAFTLPITVERQVGTL